MLVGHMELPQLIKSIAATVFPYIHEHSKRTGDTVTFNIVVTDENGENGNRYRIHSFDDAVIQVRECENDDIAYVIGTRGLKRVEHLVHGIENTDEAVSYVVQLLQEE